MGAPENLKRGTVELLLLTLLQAPVSDMLVPLDIPHLVLTSVKKSV